MIEPLKAEQAEKTEDPKNLAQLARRALQEADDQREEARQIMMGWFKADPKWAVEILSGSLEAVSFYAIATAAREMRKEFIQFTVEPTSKTDPTERLRAFTVRSVYGYTLSDGTHLGDAMKADLAGEAVMHERNELGNKRLKIWYRSLAAKMSKPRSSVSKQLSEELILDLAAQAKVSVYE